MNPKITVKILADIGMTVLLLLLMAFELVGGAAHEWIGIGIFVIFVLHHILNRKWSGCIFRKKYTPLQALQTVLVIGCLLTMVGVMVSGVILSRHALKFLPIDEGLSFSSILHMLCSYWGFVLLSLHLGVHWNMMMGIVKKHFRRRPNAHTRLLRMGAVGVAVYGAYAFIKRDIGTYMLLQSHFVFFDYKEPLVFFLLDYAAVMELFVFVGHYLSKEIRRRM